MVLRCSETSQIVTAIISDDATDILLSRQITLHMTNTVLLDVAHSVQRRSKDYLWRGMNSPVIIESPKPLFESISLLSFDI